MTAPDRASSGRHEDEGADRGLFTVTTPIDAPDLTTPQAADLARVARILASPLRIRVLNALMTAGEPLGRAQLAQQLDINQVDVDRLTLHLWRDGAIERDQSGRPARYRLHPDLLPALAMLFAYGDR